MLKERQGNKKTLLVTVFHGFVSKNILNTDAFLRIRDSGRFKIVLVVPDIKTSFFKEHYAYDNVVIEGIPADDFPATRTEALLHTVARLLIDTHYLHYKRRELFESDTSLLRPLKHSLREAFVRLFADCRWAQNTFRVVDQLLRRSVYSNLFETHQPDLVFATDIFDQNDAQFLYEAKSHNIKTLGMVRSWDNCSSKGLLRVKPDSVIVNNTVLADEVSSIHGMQAGAVSVVGLPQFDSFLKKKPFERVDFFRKYGLDPEKRLVMFAPGGNVLSDTDADICKILVSARDRGELPNNIQFFIRNHPHHPADFSGLGTVQDVHIQSPGEVLDKTTHKANELTVDDLEFLRNILAHTDVLLWVATSLCLDALVYDVPQVVVNFDGYAQKDYYRSVKRYHDEGHMKKMFIFKPFRIANNKEQLIEHISTYLKDRKIDSAEREVVRQQQLFSTDGKAGERISEILFKHLA